MSNGKTILVAGGAGFIGSNLCRRLVSNPDNLVVCIDNLYTGRKSNISSLLGCNNFVFEQRDIVDGIRDWYNADEIYNLACPASPPHYQANPVQTIKTSAIGTMNLLELARISGAKFLQASTSEVYGDPTVHPQNEAYWGNVNPIGVRSCYDEGKRCAEALCVDYNRQYGVPVKIIRIFNTYGPGMRADDGRVVSNFIMQSLSDQPITVYGRGEQTRSFQFVSDLLDGIEKVMATEDEFIGPVNLGNPDEFTILDLAKKVLSLTGSQSRIIYKPLPSDDPQRRKPDITLAESKLGWKPTVKLAEGLKKTIDYFKTYNPYE